jgi:hypothetical protein
MPCVKRNAGAVNVVGVALDFTVSKATRCVDEEPVCRQNTNPAPHGTKPFQAAVCVKGAIAGGRSAETRYGVAAAHVGIIDIGFETGNPSLIYLPMRLSRARWRVCRSAGPDGQPDQTRIGGLAGGFAGR